VVLASHAGSLHVGRLNNTRGSIMSTSTISTRERRQHRHCRHPRFGRSPSRSPCPAP
jgi:hypothetical protein